MDFSTMVLLFAWGLSGAGAVLVYLWTRNMRNNVRKRRLGKKRPERKESPDQVVGFETDYDRDEAQ